jgi:predicted nucleic acid-binding protein
MRWLFVFSMNWFDAHLWSFAEYYHIERIYSEDFQHQRIYGSVQILNPFAD